MSTIHIESKKEDIAPLVLMPGDPKRAQYIAETYLKDYKMVNKVRGMTAYTGYYDNKLVTVFPSSMGNPSMGIYSYELFKNFDVSYIIRIGSMGSYTENLKLNDVFLVNNSYSNSNYGIILNKHFNTIASSNFLNDVIKEVAKNIDINIKEGTVYSSDIFYENIDYQRLANKYNIEGVEMETFALFCNAKLLKKEATALLTVTDLFYDNEKLSSEDREKGLDKMIILSLETLKKL